MGLWILMLNYENLQELYIGKSWSAFGRRFRRQQATEFFLHF